MYAKFPFSVTLTRANAQKLDFLCVEFSEEPPSVMVSQVGPELPVTMPKPKPCTLDPSLNKLLKGNLSRIVWWGQGNHAHDLRTPGTFDDPA